LASNHWQLIHEVIVSDGAIKIPADQSAILGIITGIGDLERR
jgi:hypothetical protein